MYLQRFSWSVSHKMRKSLNDVAQACSYLSCGVTCSLVSQWLCLVLISMVEIQIILHCCVAFTFLAALATKQKYEEGSAQIVKLLVHPGQVVSVLDIEMFDKVFKEKHQVKKDIIMFTNPLLETLAIHDSSYKIKGISKPQHPKENNSIHPKPPNPEFSPEKYSIKPPPYYIMVNPPKPEPPVRSIPLLHNPQCSAGKVSSPSDPLLPPLDRFSEIWGILRRRGWTNCSTRTRRKQACHIPTEWPTLPYFPPPLHQYSNVSMDDDIKY